MQPETPQTPQPQQPPENQVAREPFQQSNASAQGKGRILAPSQEFVKEMQDTAAQAQPSEAAQAPNQAQANPAQATASANDSSAAALPRASKVASVYPVPGETMHKMPVGTEKVYDPQKDFSLSVARRASGLRVFAIVALALVALSPLTLLLGARSNALDSALILVLGPVFLIQFLFTIGALVLLLTTKNVLVARVLLALLGLAILVAFASSLRRFDIVSMAVYLALGLWLVSVYQQVRELPEVVEDPMKAAKKPLPVKSIVLVTAGIVVLAGAGVGGTLYRGHLLAERDAQRSTSPVQSRGDIQYVQQSVKSDGFTYSVVFDSESKPIIVGGQMGRDIENGQTILVSVIKTKHKGSMQNCAGGGSTVVAARNFDGQTYNLCYAKPASMGQLYAMNFQNEGTWYTLTIAAAEKATTINRQTAIGIANSIQIE